jgi:leucyl aminopeptidase
MELTRGSSAETNLSNFVTNGAGWLHMDVCIRARIY